MSKIRGSLYEWIPAEQIARPELNAIYIHIKRKLLSFEQFIDQTHNYHHRCIFNSAIIYFYCQSLP